MDATCIAQVSSLRYNFSSQESTKPRVDMLLHLLFSKYIGYMDVPV